MNIIKKATTAVKKALKPKKGKRSISNKGLAWKLDRLYSSQEDHEKAYAPKRKKAAKTRTRKK